MSAVVAISARAKDIRVAGEAWTAAIKRASAELRAEGKFKPVVARKPRAKKAKKAVAKGECFGLSAEECVAPCHMTKASKFVRKDGKEVSRKAHCGLARVGAKRLRKADPRPF